MGKYHDLCYFYIKLDCSESSYSEFQPPDVIPSFFKKYLNMVKMALFAEIRAILPTLTPLFAPKVATNEIFVIFP